MPDQSHPREASPSSALRLYQTLQPSQGSQRKTKKLTALESLGARTLEAALHRFPEARFLTIARDIALTHHERWDGSGYPQGLKGSEIPLCGRIAALADVYDALTSRRIYKLAFDHRAARTIILRDSGTHFDPDIVDAFLAIENEFLAIREAYSECSERLLAAY